MKYLGNEDGLFGLTQFLCFHWSVRKPSENCQRLVKTFCRVATALVVCLFAGTRCQVREAARIAQSQNPKPSHLQARFRC